SHPLFLIAFAIMIALQAFCFAGVGNTLRTLRFIVPVGLVICLLNPLFGRRGSTIAFYFFGNPVTLEAFAYGFVYFFMLLNVLILFVSINAALDQRAFLYLGSRFAPRTAFVLSMAVTSAARFKKRAADFVGVQKTRGNEISGTKFKDKISAALRLLDAFAARSLEEGMETAEVLKARDYGSARRTNYRSYLFGARDASILAFAFALIVIIFICAASGAAEYSFYPVLDKPGLGAPGQATFSLCAVYLALPFALYFAPAARRFLCKP
ncbi:MAG: energy-coupling factor transporter transmembrane protein EcfT, partial [Defluviitaleaceae bacterium]|nr:energy-coupling factor transporter transmembrane protein EcfT [Defluviitaleaceae bacterium]